MKSRPDCLAWPRIELKPLESLLGGRDRLDFGTVRPRVQIPGPRPFLSSKSPIFDVIRSRRVADGHRFVEHLATRLRSLSRSSADLNLDESDLVAALSCISVDATVRTVRHPVRKSQPGATD